MTDLVRHETDGPAPVPADSEPAARSGKAELWGWVRFLVALGIAVFLITHVIGFSRVSGHSMEPSLHSRDFLFVNKAARYYRSPKTGDVAVIHSGALGYDIVKRIVGLPGERVAIANGAVYVDGTPLAEISVMGEPEDLPEQTVPDGFVFVLGDNRTPGESLDSRSPELGWVPLREIRGYAVWSLFPWGSIAHPLPTDK